MKTVILVSKCMKITPANSCENWYQFHFKGVCAGESLKKVLLKGRKDFSIKKQEEYLLYVQLLSFENGIMKGSIIKVRPLDECWDKS